VDNLRVAVVAGVIVVHTATGYLTDFADWYYDELTPRDVWGTVLAFPIIAGGLFGLGPLFFLGGWFSAPSLARRGPGGFAVTRLIRLGIPLAFFVLLVQPAADFVGSRTDDVRPTFLEALADTEFSVLWFVAALLVFSLVYAGLRRWRPAAARPPVRVGVVLCAAAIAIAACSLIVWQWWPWNSEALAAARPGEWPQGGVLFALGVHAGETGWLDRLTRQAESRLGWVALTGTMVTVAVFAVLETRGEATLVLNAAAGWPTVVFAVLDGVVAVSLTLWIVTWFRRRWPRHGPLMGKAARGSYAAYLLHPLTLTAVMVLLRPVPVIPEVKFVVVSVIGVIACFLVGYAVTRLPYVRRVL
jgi:surface polysaccharide O-acyltransferase-like enzyme